MDEMWAVLFMPKAFYVVNDWNIYFIHPGEFGIIWKMDLFLISLSYNILNAVIRHLKYKSYDDILAFPFDFRNRFIFTNLVKWNIFPLLSSSPLWINFSIFDVVRHAPLCFLCEFRQPTSTAKEIFPLCTGWRTVKAQFLVEVVQSKIPFEFFCFSS